MRKSNRRVNKSNIKCKFFFYLNLGRLAADLIHKYRFDGIHYDRCIDTSTGALPIVLDLQSELPKMALVWKLLNGDREELPDDILEPNEKCALHWMISYSVNTTFRIEEYFYNPETGDPYGMPNNFKVCA